MKTATQVTLVLGAIAMGAVPAAVADAFSGGDWSVPVPASGSPSGKPTGSPSGKPSGSPSGKPTGSPSGSPSGKPSGSPSASPSASPTSAPTGSPSVGSGSKLAPPKAPRVSSALSDSVWY